MEWLDGTISRRAVLTVLASLPAASLAQQTPSNAIRLVVPAAPGSSTDLTARILAEGLRKELQQTIVIENKAGASGAIGSEALAKAAPDGKTIGLMTVGALAINPFLYSKLRYDPVNDFAPIAFGGHTPSLLVVQASSPYRTVADIVRAAQQSPGKLNYASAGNGTTSHIAGEVIKSQARVQIQHVPFKSGGGLNALLGGLVDFTFYHPISVQSQIREGRLRALAVSSARRMSGFPDVPTMVEQGFPGFDMTAWYAFMGPRGLGVDATQRLSQAIAGAFGQSTVAAQLADQGVEIEHLHGAQLAAYLDSERQKWARLVQLSGATLG